jgi:hypothetical protein
MAGGVWDIRAAYEDMDGFVNAKSAGSGVNIPSNQRDFTDYGFGNSEALLGDARDVRVEVHRHDMIAFRPRLESHVVPNREDHHKPRKCEAPLAH